MQPASAIEGKHGNRQRFASFAMDLGDLAQAWLGGLFTCHVGLMARGAMFCIIGKFLLIAT
ncbi:MAG: hypothetical protein L0H73_00305 [Nitrococcus sp.]|nr:hypothetical protein [Nitrococcus sp.]